MNAVEITYEVLFYALFVAAASALRRRPGMLALDVLLLFTTLAGLFVIQRIQEFVPGTPDALSQLGLALLLAQPAMALRVTRHVRALARPVGYAMAAGYVIALGVMLASGSDRPAAIAIAVGYFVIGNGAAAWILGSEALRRAGFARWRLMAAAAAMAALAIDILVAGVAGSGATAIVRGLAVMVGVAFFVAFSPPRWLRRIGQHAVAYDFIRDLGSVSPGTGTALLWERLAAATARLTGAVVVDAGEADPGQAAAAAAPAPEPPGPVTEVWFRHGGRDGVVRLASRRLELFAGDDLALIELLGAQTLAAVAREAELAERTALAQQLTNTNVELERASRAKSDFLAAMSHELRTPLNAIIGFSELLADPPGDAPVSAAETHDFAGHIHQAGLHLLELINDILDLSRVEAGRLELHRAETDVLALLTETVATVRPLADARGLTLTAPADPPLTADVDPARLRQVIYNLLSNAIKFTPAGGSVGLELEVRAETFRISVVDSGPGIPLEDQQRVFAPFEQLTPDAGVREGSGLGLALTRELVQAHSGHITLDSAPGHGSRFTVELPKVWRNGVPVAHASVGAEAGDGPLVLIVEDDVAAAELLRLQLGQAGYRPVVAGTGESGLDAARRLQPAAILLDILLPGMDGWEVLRQLRADPRIASIPVMVITVVESPAVGLALGAVDYLVKPVARETLLAALDRLDLMAGEPSGPSSVLAIGADPSAEALYEQALVPEGFELLGAATGEEGLARAREPGVRFIIIDLTRPDFDGFEIAARLNADPATAGIPIVVVTAQALTDVEKERLTNHVIGVVTKDDRAQDGLRAWLDRVSAEVAG